MPASFKVTQVPVEGGQFGEYEEHLDPDFGESAIGRVAPVDSGEHSVQYTYSVYVLLYGSTHCL